MDDYYVIVPPNRSPKEILNSITEKAKELELTINPNKTHIIPLTKPFCYCKAKYRLKETGKVIINGNRKNAQRSRKCIKTFYTKVKNGEMSYEDLWASVNGRIAYFNGYNDHGRVLRLRRLFLALVGFSLENINNFKERGKYEIHSD